MKFHDVALAVALLKGASEEEEYEVLAHPEAWKSFKVWLGRCSGRFAWFWRAVLLVQVAAAGLRNWILAVAAGRDDA